MGNGRQIGDRDARLGGVIAGLVGLLVIAISIWADESGFHAPRWVVGAAGGVFLLAGIAILFQGRPLLASLSRALLLTCFGAVFTWVSLGPGERQFTSTISLPFISVTGATPQITGRICFAPGALLLDGLALYTWFLLVRDWLLRDMRRD